MFHPTIVGVLLWCTTHCVVAPRTPSWMLSGVDEAAGEFNPEHIAWTELSLGPSGPERDVRPHVSQSTPPSWSPWQTTAAPQLVWQPQDPRNLVLPGVPVYRLSPPGAVLLRSPEQVPLPQGFAEASASHDPPRFAETAQARIAPDREPVPLTPNFDESLVAALSDPRNGDQLELPTKVEHIESAWFDAFYRKLFDRFRTRNWGPPQKMVLSIEDVAFILKNKLGSPRVLDAVYVVQVPDSFTDEVAPGSVLLRHHRALKLPSDRALKDVVSAWCTTRHGTGLAFLGLYYFPRRFLGNVKGQLRAETFQVLSASRGQIIHLQPSGTTSNG